MPLRLLPGHKSLGPQFVCRASKSKPQLAPTSAPPHTNQTTMPTPTPASSSGHQAQLRNSDKKTAPTTIKPEPTCVTQRKWSPTVGCDLLLESRWPRVAVLVLVVVLVLASVAASVASADAKLSAVLSASTLPLEGHNPEVSLPLQLATKPATRVR